MLLLWFADCFAVLDLFDTVIYKAQKYHLDVHLHWLIVASGIDKLACTAYVHCKQNYMLCKQNFMAGILTVMCVRLSMKMGEFMLWTNWVVKER